MTILKPIGFFREFGFANWNGPISEVVSVLPLSDEENILAYLRKGITILLPMQIDRDILSPEGSPIGSPAFLTDGHWLWLRTLGHYVEHYHCRLPDEFI